MLRDEQGKELALNDAVKLKFPEGVRCGGVVAEIRKERKKDGKVRGTMIVRSHFEVVFDDFDEAIKGIVKLPPNPKDYSEATRHVAALAKIAAKGTIKIPRADLDPAEKVKRRA